MLARVNDGKGILASYRLASYWQPLHDEAVAYPFYRSRYASLPIDDPGQGGAVVAPAQPTPGKHAA
jgi:hypothetical protein